MLASACSGVQATPFDSISPSASISSSPIDSSSSPTPSTVVNFGYEIIKVYPHDTGAFTEGLAFDAIGKLYEGTGLKGKSSLRQVDLTTGKVLRQYDLPAEYFGEGIAVYQEKIIQLTWQSHIGFVYNKGEFALLGDFSYNSEGWGLTYDGTHLIMSDGTANLYFLNPETFKVMNTVAVNDDGAPVNNINELEYINGQVYANIWKTDKIAIIDPATGRITGWVDLSGLLASQGYTGKVDVLNGIAYDAGTQRLFITGKYWPYIFEIKLVEKS
jgi:glutamine cyclotransferase